MARVRVHLATFMLGFASCALVARLMLPEPVAAVTPAAFRTANPADVVEAVGESVVSLEVYPRRAPRSGEGWPRLFGWPIALNPGEPEAVASGVIISEKGYIVTNDHVVEDSGRIRVRLADGRAFDASLVGRDPHTDLAVVKVPGRNLQVARVADSRRVRPGEPVVAIGNPLGFENSVSVGVVSANRRGPFRVDGRTLGDMIQTDAAINQGNSGGGLFTADGSLVGINTAILVPRGAGGSIGIGFAIPSHQMTKVTEALISRGRIPRPWLGIRYQPSASSPFIRRVQKGVGVVVEDVVPGSPAARAGLLPADIIQRLGDCPISSPDDVYTFISRYQAGENVEARILRGGERRTLTIRLGDHPGS